MDNRLVSFSASSQIVVQSGSVESNCNGMVFINIGTDTVTILGYPLTTGQQFSVPCNIGEVDETNYIIQFAGITVNQQCLVIRKEYKSLIV